MTFRRHFIHRIIEQDMTRCPHLVVTTRFAPEPNGFLHIGHLKAIVLNYDIASHYQGKFYLRFDDTNPMTSRLAYYKQIYEDLSWLGLNTDNCYYTSDYFERLYGEVIRLIRMNKAYVCSHSWDEIKAMRGNLTQPGTPSCYRDRTVTDNLILLDKMRCGLEKKSVVRAKISMSAGNVHLRDPVLFRIKDLVHPHTKKNHYLYPSYDFAHPLSDYYENITHSLCTREFEDHRKLYNWILRTLYPADTSLPQQIEYARLVIENMPTSKRVLLKLKDELQVELDHPSFPTLAGLRQRGVPPQALLYFVRQLGISRQESIIDKKTVYAALNRYLHGHISDKTHVVLRPHPFYLESQLIYIDKDDFWKTASRPKDKMIRPGVVFGLIGHKKAYQVVVHDDYDRIEVTEGKPGFYLHHVGQNSHEIEVHDYTHSFRLFRNARIASTDVSHIFHGYRVGYFRQVSPKQYYLFARLKSYVSNENSSSR